MPQKNIRTFSLETLLLVSLGTSVAVLGAVSLFLFISHETIRMQQQFVNNYISQTNVLAQLSAEYVHYNNPAILTLGTTARLKQDSNILMARFTNIDGMVVSSFVESEVGQQRKNLAEKELQLIEPPAVNWFQEIKNIAELNSNIEVFKFSRIIYSRLNVAEPATFYRFKQELKAWNQPMGWIELDVSHANLNAAIQHLQLTFAIAGIVIIFSFILSLSILTRILITPIGKLAKTLNSLGIKAHSGQDFQTELQKLDISNIKTSFTELGTFMNSFSLLKRELIKSFAELNLANEELQIKNQKLNQFDKIRDDILSSTSHELRTPLHGIMGMAEILLYDSKNPLSEIQSQSVEIIHKCAKRLAKLASESLNVSAIKSGKTQIQITDFSIYQLVCDVFLLFKNEAQLKNIQLINNIEVDFEMVIGDIDKSFQILVNLVGNALKFTPSGSITFSAVICENKAHISVSDTGMGISKSNLDFIFEPYAQEKTYEGSSEKGVGLGLAISRELARLQQGELFAQSIQGSGSKFTLCLNLKNTNNLAVLMPAASQTYLSQNPTLTPAVEPEQFIILAVDDEPLNLKILERFLGRKKEYQFYSAPNASEALLLQSKIKPDIILLDVRMPEISGLEMCRMLREKHSLGELPIIFLTASNLEEDIESCQKAGGNDFISKPIAMAELLSRVETQLKISRSYRNLASSNLPFIQPNQPHSPLQYIS